MTPVQLGNALRFPVFADRGTDIQDAITYALQIANASENPPAVTTAVFVVVNTIANVLMEMKEPEQPRGKFE